MCDSRSEKKSMVSEVEAAALISSRTSVAKGVKPSKIEQELTLLEDLISDIYGRTVKWSKSDKAQLFSEASEEKTSAAHLSLKGKKLVATYSSRDAFNNEPSRIAAKKRGAAFDQDALTSSFDAKTLLFEMTVVDEKELFIQLRGALVSLPVESKFFDQGQKRNNAVDVVESGFKLLTGGHLRIGYYT